MSKKSHALRAAICGTVSSAAVALMAAQAFAADVSQSSASTNTVSNLYNSGFFVSGDVGLGSVASTSATGASAITSTLDINTSATPAIFNVALSLDSVIQSATNSGNVSNLGLYVIVAGDIAAGASVASTATGAVTSIAGTFIAPDVSSILSSPMQGSAIQLGDTITQVASNSGIVANSNALGLFIQGDLVTGAVAAISATGAIASASLSFINVVQLNTVDIAATGLFQTALNINTVSNVTSNLAISGNLETGASASVSALGAGASLSVSSVNSVLTTTTNIGPVTQNATNAGSVVNSGAMVVGTLGAGASASIQATGALSSVSVKYTSNENYGITSFLNTGSITQSAINSGTVNNTGSSLLVADIAGNGASASISATGATASVAVTSINANASIAPVTQTVSQNVLNTGAISNSGTLTVGSLGGAGASASISAAGAVAAVSFATIH